jgi:hypothetical protein
MALTDPRPGEDDDTGCDDDTDYDYYDTPSGNIWRPGAEPGQPPGDEPGRPGRGASLSFPDRPHAASPPRPRTRTSRQGDPMSTTQPPAGRAPEGGAAARPGRRHLGPAPAAITTAGRDLPDKATPVPAAIAREHTASKPPDTGPGKLTQALRAIAGASPPEASQRPGQTT